MARISSGAPTKFGQFLSSNLNREWPGSSLEASRLLFVQPLLESLSSAWPESSKELPIEIG